MKIVYIIICFLFITNASAQKLFEGELVYHHKMKLNSKDYSESRKFYDTLKIVYKSKNFIKITNKADYEKLLFIDSLKKRYVIYKDNLSKSKRLSMNEEDLKYGDLYNRENSHFGKVISLRLTDTLFRINNEDEALKKLFVERKYGNETYIFSESDDLKLSNNRNILRNVGEQIHPIKMATILNNSLLYFYKLELNKTSLSKEYRLIHIEAKKIKDKVFDIPKHKDAKGFRKENRKDGRYKYYEILNSE